MGGHHANASLLDDANVALRSLLAVREEGAGQLLPWEGGVGGVVRAELPLSIVVNRGRKQPGVNRQRQRVPSHSVPDLTTPPRPHTPPLICQFVLRQKQLHTAPFKSKYYTDICKKKKKIRTCSSLISPLFIPSKNVKMLAAASSQKEGGGRGTAPVFGH